MSDETDEAQRAMQWAVRLLLDAGLTREQIEEGFRAMLDAEEE